MNLRLLENGSDDLGLSADEIALVDHWLAQYMKRLRIAEGTKRIFMTQVDRDSYKSGIEVIPVKEDVVNLIIRL